MNAFCYSDFLHELWFVYQQALYDDIVWKYIRYEFYQPLSVIWVHDEKSVKCTKTCDNGKWTLFVIISFALFYKFFN